tara:strand:- start:206 stop:502 length:297 start_codon:yes stop_codon:yes gene_type:complete
MNSKRRELYDLTREAAAKIKRLKGIQDDLATDWEEIVEACEKSVMAATRKGEFKYFFDAAEHSMKTTEKIASSLKDRLDDVLIIVSPRGIEINWESPE